MAPTLLAGQHVLAEKVSRHGGDWQRGDVVALRRTPQSDLLVKRIVGLAGDRVALQDGRLVVNGDRVDEPWTDESAVDSVYFGPVTVPAGSLFVLGDDRANSRDSRAFGPVPASAVLSRVDAVIWPMPPTREGLS
jgi:signal peptidase I